MATKKDVGVTLTHPDGERTHIADSPTELHTLLGCGYRIAEKGVTVAEAVGRLTGTVTREPVTTTGSQQPVKTDGGKGAA